MFNYCKRIFIFIFCLCRMIIKKHYDRRQLVYEKELGFVQSIAEFSDINGLYAYFNHHYHYLCPQFIREHREYFKRNNRSFGEDAFHAMWWLLLSDFRPAKVLEIGVYRGQIISLWSLIGRYLNYQIDIHGISPFSYIGDSVSKYQQELDYMKDVLNSFEYWHLPSPKLIKALSSDPEAVSHIRDSSWDMIYIDGSHDFEAVLADYKLCHKHLKTGGILVIDDASLDTGYNPPCFAFIGHPGPSRVAREHADKEMKRLGIVGHNNIYRKI